MQLLQSHFTHIHDVFALSRNVSPKCTNSTHRGDAPSSPIEWQDHCQTPVLLSQLSSKKSNKQSPLTSLNDSHWAWRAYQVSLLCFELFDQDLSFLFSAPDPFQVNTVECLYPVSMRSNLTLCWWNPIESWLGLIVKKGCILITNRTNRCCSCQCFNLWRRVAMHCRVVIRSWWRDGIVMESLSLLYAVSWSVLLMDS